MQPLLIIAVSSRSTRLVAGILAVLCQLSMLWLLWFLSRDTAPFSVKPAQGLGRPRVSLASPRTTPAPPQTYAKPEEAPQVYDDPGTPPLDEHAAPETTQVPDTQEPDIQRPDAQEPDPVVPVTAAPASSRTGPIIDQPQAVTAPTRSTAQDRRNAWKKSAPTEQSPTKGLPGLKNIPRELLSGRTVQALYEKEPSERAIAQARLQELSGWHVQRRILNTMSQAFDDNPIPYHSATDLQTSISARLIFNPEGTIRAVEIIRSTGYPDLDAHLSTIIMKMKTLELPGNQAAGQVYSYTFNARVTTRQGSVHFVCVTDSTAGIYRS